MPGTSPDNLTYPDASGGTSIWQHVQNLATSAQAALTARHDVWNNWPLVWDTASGGGFLSVGGAGSSQGFYQQCGKLVHAEFRVELASGFSIDSGTFLLVLPVPAFVWGASGISGCIGTWTARDDSASGAAVTPRHYGGSLGLWAAASDRVHFAAAVSPFPNTGPTNFTPPYSRIDSNDPIPWAAGDVLAGNLTYRAA